MFGRLDCWNIDSTDNTFDQNNTQQRQRTSDSVLKIALNSFGKLGDLEYRITSMLPFLFDPASDSSLVVSYLNPTNKPTFIKKIKQIQGVMTDRSWIKDHQWSVLAVHVVLAC